MRRERRAFLPADQVAGMVAGKVDAAIGRLQRGQSYPGRSYSKLIHEPRLHGICPQLM